MSDFSTHSSPAAPGVPATTGQVWASTTVVPVCCALLSGGFALAICGGFDQPTAALLLFLVLGMLALFHPRAAVIGTLAYLALMGELRRLLLPEAGQSAWDPMILIGPAMAMLLVGLALHSRGLRLRTGISRAVMLLMAVMALQMFNPVQGGVTIGLAGGLFYLVPLLWFWVGQWLGSQPFLSSLFRFLVIPVAVGACLLGIYQAFFGLLAHQERWVELSGYASLYLAAGLVRPFSFFTSSAEFGYYVSGACAILMARLYFPRPRFALFLIPLMLTAVFLQGSRTIFLTIPAAAAALWSVQGRDGLTWLRRLATAVVCLVPVIVILLITLPSVGSASRIAPILEHQVGGLLNPLDSRRSTASAHGAMILGGLASGVTNPFGHGLGATTLAARKFGGDALSTEFDVSDLFVSLGLVGGVIYLVLVYLVLRRGLRYWLRKGDWVALAVLGLLVSQLGNWLIGGHYAVVALLWFCIGALDRSHHNSLEASER